MSRNFEVPVNLLNSPNDPIVGYEGDIYYNTTTNVIRLYKNGAWEDIISANTAEGSPGYYGSYYDTTTQTLVNGTNAEHLMTFDSVSEQNGISIETYGGKKSRITFAHSGIYNIQFSAQLHKPTSSGANVYIWLKKNGTDIAESSGTTGLSGNNSKIVAAWNYVMTMTAGQYLEFAWSADNTGVELLHNTAPTSGPHIPSLILTVQQVASYLTGGGGSGASVLDDLTDVVQTDVTDNEVLAYDHETDTWINQTALEANLATRNGWTHNSVITIKSYDGITDGAINLEGYQNKIQLSDDNGITITSGAGTKQFSFNNSGNINLPGNIVFTDTSSQSTAFLGISSYDTNDINEGTTNLYFTDTRAVNALTTTLADYLTETNAGTTYLTKIDAASTYQPIGSYITEETDPIFTASASYGIMGANIANWNDAFDWGDHSLAGYALDSHNHTLNSLSNVEITGTPTDGQAIVWDTATSKWVNETVSSGDSFPTQTGNNGKFLQTNGSTVSWANETDPVFLASEAYGITSTDTSNWDTAYGWGDHSIFGYLTTESDPVFIASAAYNIISLDITNWNSAYSWGDHSLAGYLTEYAAETDPIFAASEAFNITSTDTNNWDSAYNWGDHALVGYLTSYSETSTLEDVTDRGATSSNAITISNTTQSTTPTTGALIISGGVGIAKDVWIDGNLHVNGTTETLHTHTVATSDNLIYLNAAHDSTITNAVGDGTYVIYTADNDYTPGMDIRVTGMNPSGYNISSADGLTVYSATSTQFVVEKTTIGTFVSGGTAHAKTEANPDLGFAGGYYDAGYAHAGLFRDASDGVFKFFQGYTPEPDEAVNIDTTHASFAFATIAAKSISSSYAGNFGIGYETFIDATPDNQNFSIGTQSSYLNTGFSNYGIGNGSLSNNTGNYNFVFGSNAGFTNSGSDNYGIGVGALYNNTGNSNSGFGNTVLSSNSGTSNFGIGDYALSGNTGDYNYAFGYNPGYSNTGDNNLFIGTDTGIFNSGSYNYAIGTNAGSNNTGNNNLFIGSNSGYGNTGNSNIYIGPGVGLSTDNNIVIYDVQGNLAAKYNSTDYKWQLGGFSILFNDATLKSTVSGVSTISGYPDFSLTIAEFPINDSGYNTLDNASAAECFIVLSSNVDGSYYSSKVLVFGDNVTEYAIINSGTWDVTLVATPELTKTVLSATVTNPDMIAQQVYVKVVSTSFSIPNRAS